MIYRHWPFCNINPDIATILYCTAQHKCNTLQHSRQHNAYAAPNIVAFAPCLLFMNRRHLLLHIQALSRIAPTPRVAHSFSRKKKAKSKQRLAASFFLSTTLFFFLAFCLIQDEPFNQHLYSSVHRHSYHTRNNAGNKTKTFLSG